MGRRRRAMQLGFGLPFVAEFLVTPRPRKNQIPSLGLYQYDETQTRGLIEDIIRGGNHDQALVAVEVAEQLYGGRSLFPPGPRDDPSAQCVWALVLDLVQDVFSKKRFAKPKRQYGIVWELRNIDDLGYPWEQPALNIDNHALPGTFIDLNRQGSPADYDALIRDYLANALRSSNMNHMLAYGSSTTSKRLRREARKLFNDVQWHDQVYTHHGASEPWMLNSQGRALHWESHHANNIERIAKGQPPKRTIDLFGETISEDGVYAMLLWLPPVDKAALQQRVPTVVPTTWSDGTSTQEPPPVIRNLGVDASGVELT